jgi:mitochondrial protein import protein ZIM17
LTMPPPLSRHLIADHIGWFKESTEDGKLKTIEDILRARGEQVTRGRLGSDGDIEYYPSEPDEPPKGS